MRETRVLWSQRSSANRVPRESDFALAFVFPFFFDKGKEEHLATQSKLGATRNAVGQYRFVLIAIGDATQLKKGGTLQADGVNGFS